MVMLTLALIVVFFIGFTATYNIRVLIRTWGYDSLSLADVVLSSLVGAGLAFLFYYLT